MNLTTTRKLVEEWAPPLWTRLKTCPRNTSGECFCDGACLKPPAPLRAVAPVERPKVYLAGPIAGMTFAQANGWRQYATEALASAGIDALNPLRDKEHLDTGGPLANDFDGGDEAVCRDLEDIDNSDAVLLYCDYESNRKSIGSCAELGYAYAEEKHIIAVVPQHGAMDHIFVKYMADRVVPTLDGGIAAIKEMIPA